MKKALSFGLIILNLLISLSCTKGGGSVTSPIEKIEKFSSYPVGQVVNPQDFTVNGQLGIISVGGVNKLTSIQGQSGTIYKEIGQNYFRFETTINVASNTLPTPSGSQMVAVGVTQSDTDNVAYGIGIYSDGTIKAIVNGVATTLSSAWQTVSPSVQSGKYRLRIAGKNGKIYVSYSNLTNPNIVSLGKEITLPTWSNYFVALKFTTAQSSFASGYGTGHYAEEISFRNDWSCYTNVADQKELYLCPVFSGGTDPAWIIVPKDQDLMGSKQRIAIWSHGHTHDQARIFDFFPEIGNPNNTYPTINLITRGYAVIYVEGRPRCHWGNQATETQANNARQFLVDNLNFEQKAFTYGGSMGGLFALNFAHFFPQYTGAIAADVPVANLKEFYFNSPGNEDIADAYGWTYTSMNEYDSNDPFYTYAYLHDPTRNAADYVNFPIRIEAGSQDAIVPPGTMIDPFVNAVRAAGGTKLTYTIEDKGHAVSITTDELVALYDTVPREPSNNNIQCSADTQISVLSNTIQCSADTLIAILTNTIQCSADTLITIISEDITTVDLEISAPIDIPVSINMDISPAIAQLDLSINALTKLPASIHMAINSTLQYVSLPLAVKVPMKLRSLVNMLILRYIPYYHSTSTYRFREIPNQYTFIEITTPYNSKEIANQYTWKGVESMYQYLLGEKKPVQVEWTRKDGKPFAITNAVYSFESTVDGPMSIDGKTTLINLEPTSITSKYCKIEVELTPTDPNLPVEKHIAEVQIAVKAPKIA